MKLVVNSKDEYSVFGVGNDDNTTYVISLKTQKDIDIVYQLYVFHHNWILDDGYENRREEFVNTLYKAQEEKDFLFVGEDCGKCIWVYGTKSELIENLNNACKQNS